MIHVEKEILLLLPNKLVLVLICVLSNLNNLKVTKIGRKWVKIAWTIISIILAQFQKSVYWIFAEHLGYLIFSKCMAKKAISNPNLNAEQMIKKTYWLSIRSISSWSTSSDNFLLVFKPQIPEINTKITRAP